MPTYDYTCVICLRKNSVTASIHETISAPLCPNCKSEMIRTYFSAPIHFKGDGWAGKK